MALKVKNLEGNEIADDYIRNTVPKGRFGDTWGVFKSSFTKLILINIFTLITLVPAIVIVIYRSLYISGLGLVYPFNPSILYPFYPDVEGLTERLTLSADLVFYSLLIVAGFIASVGFAGAAYSIRKLLNTHGEFSFKSYLHGIKVCYLKTVLPVTIFVLFLFATLITGDWMHLVIATGGNAAGAITAYVFVIIANVLVGIYCGWLFAVGTSYRAKLTQIFKNAFVLMVGTPIQTIIIAAISLIPVWLLIIGGVVQIIAYIVFILIGFSFMVICWTAFTQWAFDIYVSPNLKPAKENEKPQKSPDALAKDKEQDEKQHARELLAAGRSELIARPVMPISEEPAVPAIGKTFSRSDVFAVNESRQKLVSDVAAYEKAHENDPVYAEYNKLFAEREKALKVESDKKSKKKKISSDNLLK